MDLKQASLQFQSERFTFSLICYDAHR